jgi:death on curing protein
MKREPKWVEKRALLLLHEESLAEFGGSRGLRDEGLLESALDRARNKYSYDRRGCTIAVLAAAYGFAMARNHPFVDGNKRAAFLSIGVFLAMNGYELRADPVEAIAMIEELAAGRMEEAALAEWIGAHSVKG